MNGQTDQFASKTGRGDILGLKIKNKVFIPKAWLIYHTVSPIVIYILHPRT